MQRRNDTFLQRRTQIDEQIAATDQVEIGKWRVLDEILTGEDAHVADRLVNAVAAIEAQEKARQALGADSRYRRFRVQPSPGAVQSSVADIGGKDLRSLAEGRGGGACLLPHVFQQHDSNGIDFLAARATRDPDADGSIVQLAVLKESGKDVVA